MDKCGLSVSTIAERCEMRHGTINRWFDWCEERPIRDAIADHRHWTSVVAGRSAFERFESVVNDPLGESGHEQLAWATALVQRLLRDEAEAEHSQCHLQRSSKKAGPRLSDAAAAVADDCGGRRQ